MPYGKAPGANASVGGTQRGLVWLAVFLLRQFEHLLQTEFSVWPNRSASLDILTQCIRDLSISDLMQLCHPTIRILSSRRRSNEKLGEKSLRKRHRFGSRVGGVSYSRNCRQHAPATSA